MRNEFHAIFERDGDWFDACCPEIPEANGFGNTQIECRENLIEAIQLILQDRYEDSFKKIIIKLNPQLYIIFVLFYI